MNRRGFLSSLAAFVAVPFVPKPKPQPLAFHPDAFALTMQPLARSGARIGDTIRVRLPQRFDTLHGYAQKFAADTYVSVTKEP